MKYADVVKKAGLTNATFEIAWELTSSETLWSAWENMDKLTEPGRMLLRPTM
jgi:hypothetical protein